MSGMAFPLRVSRIFLGKISLIDAQGRHVAVKTGEITPEDSEAFRYLAASANWCKDIPPKVFEAGDDDSQVTLGAYFRMEKRCDKMLTVLQMALRHVPKDSMEYSEGTHGERIYPADVIRSLIAEVEASKSPRPAPADLEEGNEETHL